MAATSELGKLFDEWQAGHRFAPSKREVAAALGVAPNTIDKWRTGTRPSPERLAALAGEMHYPYRKLLDAVLVDQGYLPEPKPGRLRRRVTGAARDRKAELDAERQVMDDDQRRRERRLLDEERQRQEGGDGLTGSETA